MEKTCRKCGEVKKVSEFYRAAKNRDGYENHCKDCRNARMAQYKSGERARTLRKNYHKSEGFKASNRNSILKRLYGITSDEYDSMLHSQGGVCAICSKEDAAGRRLAVDHCHATGKVRGLLCGACNVALGKFRDSPELLANAIKYLQENQ